MLLQSLLSSWQRYNIAMHCEPHLLRLYMTPIDLKAMGFFFSSLQDGVGPEAKALGLVFSETYPWGSFALSALPR
jgi:hypothetical protein